MTLGLTVVAVFCAGVLACRHSDPRSVSRDAGQGSELHGPVVCVENDDGCILCRGPRDSAPFLEPEQSRPVRCDPADTESCFEFCSQVIAECALPWSKTKGCVFASELDWRRALFNQEAAGRPEIPYVGRAADESGRRLEGVKVRWWVSRDANLLELGETITNKDGSFRIPLRAGPWTYAMRLSHPGRASVIVEKIAPDRLDRTNPGSPHPHRLGSEQVVRGRVLDARTGAPVEGTLIFAHRSPDEAIAISEATTTDDGSFTLSGLEAGRYHLRADHFGWWPATLKGAVTAPSQKISIKLARAGVIRGVVLDADNEAEPDATVVAVAAGVPGVPRPFVNWPTDAKGRFSQDRFALGTYYLWARRGEMQVYPPVKKEILEGQDIDVELRLGHKGARVSGQVRWQNPGNGVHALRVRMVSRSPLAFPRPVVAEVDATGRFVGKHILPGRYEITVMAASRVLTILEGPREVEIPIEPGSSVTLPAALVVRAQTEE